MSKIVVSVASVVIAGVVGGGIFYSTASASSGDSKQVAIVPPTTGTSTTTTLQAPVTMPAPKPVVAKSDFDNKVSEFYRQYLAADNLNGNPKAVMDRFMTKAASDSTWATGADFDAVLCAQNTPQSTSVGAPKVQGDKVTVVVTQTWGGTPKTSFPVTGRVSDGLVTSVSCPNF